MKAMKHLPVDEEFDAPPVPWMHGAAGIAGGAISMAVFYPLDFLRTRLQAQDGSNRTKLRGARLIVKEEGVKGLYRGVTIAVSSHSIGWGLYLTFFRTVQQALARGTGTFCAPNDFIAACCAAVCTSTLVTPLNVLKTRKQLHDNATASSGSVAGLKRIVREEGWKSLFRGVGPQILLSSHTTIQVAMYEFIKRELWPKGDAPVFGIALASALSKSVAVLFCNPLEVCRTRLQDQRNVRLSGEYGSMSSTFKTIWRNEGMRGLYRGIFVNVCRVVPTTVLAMILYEQFVETLHYLSKKESNGHHNVRR